MRLKCVMAGEPPSSAPTLVLLHGYGADEHDLIPIGDELGRPFAVASLQGPLSLGGPMRAWYNLEPQRDGFRIDPDEVRAADALVAEALIELHAARGKLVLLGFSQGACMAARAALSMPERVRALISLSGVPPGVAPLERAQPAALQGLPAFAAHGTFDQLLPLARGQQMRDALAGAGFDLTWREYPMAHMVAGEELADLNAWLVRAMP